MANKKLTPIRELIEKIREEAKFYKSNSNSADKYHANGLAEAMSLLIAYLPKEKEFAREMWGNGKSFGYNQHFPEAEPKPTFDEFFKQYEQ